MYFRNANACCLLLEPELQGKLNQPGIVDRLRDNAEVRRVDILPRREELGMVEEVEELGPELQFRTFARKLEVLDCGEVCVHEARSIEGCSARVPEFSGWGINVTIGIEELRDGGIVQPSVAKLVGAIRVAGEADSRTVRTGDQEQGESRRDLLDYIHFPVTQNRIYRPIPIVAELLASSEGQVVNDAGREAMGEMNL